VIRVYQTKSESLDMKLPKIFNSKPFLGILLIALIFAGAIEYKQYSERKSIDNEIAELEAEERRLTEANNQLQQSIGFLSSPEYQEKLARLQLNLKKPDEIVVNFPKEPEGQQTEVVQVDSRSNLFKWWEYIFIN